MRKPSGYTILEVLVAVTILAIALPGLSMLLLGSRKVQVSSLRFENAAAYGQKVYDDLSLLPPARVAATGSSSVVIDGQTYKASWQKTALTLGGNSVQITVGWRVGGKDRTSILNGVLP